MSWGLLLSTPPYKTAPTQLSVSITKGRRSSKSGQTESAVRAR